MLDLRASGGGHFPKEPALLLQPSRKGARKATWSTNLCNQQPPSRLWAFYNKNAGILMDFVNEITIKEAKSANGQARRLL